MAGDLVARRPRGGRRRAGPGRFRAQRRAAVRGGPRAAPSSRLILTASGGPFREWEPERVARATVEEALNHPTWRMGSKITVDSATLANKALEVIEAHHLFGLPYDAIEVVVHPQSIVHAFVEFCDGSVIAQLGFPSMELPILYALTHPGRLPDAGVRRFDPVAAGPLTFEPVRHDVFRALRAPGSPRAGPGAPRRRCSTRPTRTRWPRSWPAGSPSAGSPRPSSGCWRSTTAGPATTWPRCRAADAWARAARRWSCCREHEVIV